MEVKSSCEDIRARKSHIGQLCAIGSASDSLHFWGDSKVFHGSFCHFYDVHFAFELFFHVEILFFYLYFKDIFAIFLVEFRYFFCDEFLAVFKFLLIVVTDDVL